MKKVLLLSGILALGAVASFGATACTTGTLASYAALTTTGCENGDKIFSNFVYTPGSGDPTAGSVSISLDNNPGISLFGLQFGSPAPGFVSNFMLTYTITIDQTACHALFSAGDCSMIAAQGSFQGALAPNSAALTDTLSGATTVSLNDLATNNNTQQQSFLGVTATNVTIQSSGLTASAPINSFGLDVYQTAVPEPMTLSLMGAGLLGLGLLRKRIGRS